MNSKVKPRVGITTRPLEKGVSGSGMHLDRLLRAFVQLDHGFELYFLHHTERRPDLYQHGTPFRIARNPLLAAAKIARLQLDIIHFSPLSIFSPMLAQARFRCATLHPDDELIIPECYSWIRRVHSRQLVGAYARRMDAIFTVSRTSRDLLVKEYGLAPEKIVLTPNATDAKYQPLDATRLVETHRKYTAGRPFILHVSNFSARKNPWTLLKAFRHTVKSGQFPDLLLVIVGNGWSQNEMVGRYLQEHNMAGHVLLTGFIPEADLPKLFNLAKLFVFPSLSEGFGMPNLEAMACGCPVITTDAFAIPEVVGGAAWILKNKLDHVELAEAIHQLLFSDTDRARLQTAGLQRVQDFSWEKSARNLLATYRRLLTA